jgi:class 3 adenylate cyclase/TolB-like protein
MEENQRLSTIVFGDIKGYTALMQEDEARAMSLLEVFKSGLEAYVPSFGGKIVQYFGDACLLSFESTSKAVRCAIRLQPLFREKGLPVRFGIHLGEVIFTADNVFGDGVNVASRIESMGVAGGILVSKTVKDQLANKPEFKLKNMGQFDFKNVEEPLEVFAIENDGIVVPRRKELQGKFKPPKPRSILKPVLLAAVVLLVVISGIWLMRPDKTQLNEAQRNSYLAVIPFENKTGETGLDAFGSLISDRLTAQLMATGQVKILPAGTLKKQAATAGIPMTDIPEYFAGNGIGMIITGRYYTQDDQLYVQMNIVDTGTGQVVNAPSPIIRPLDEKSEILEDLSDHVLSFWEVRDQSRFRQKPPRYEAYREFQAGVDDFAQAFDSGDEDYYLMAEIHFLKAYELDTTFLSPLLRLHVVYHNMDRFREKDSLFTALKERKNNMTIWERKSYEYEWERNYGSFLEEARSAASMFEMDPSDNLSLTRAYIGYIRGNYPGKAIAFWQKAYPMLMEEMKNRFKPNEWLDLPLYMLREFDSIYTMYNLDVQDVDWDPIMNLIYAQVLVQIGRSEEVPERLLMTPDGGRHGKPVFLYRICNTFMLKGEDSLARSYAGQLKEFALANPDQPDYLRWLGAAEMFMGNYKEAAHYLEACLDMDWDTNVQADLIACYAQIGAMEKIDRAVLDLPQMSKREGYTAYYLARAQAILGNHDKAIERLASAIQGRVPFDTESYGFDYHFRPLFEDPRFQRLVAPKG